MTIGDDYAGIDFYCDIAIPHATELVIVHEDVHVLAFHHTKPHWKTHVVVAPKRHIASLTSATTADTPALLALFAAVKKIARHVEEHEGAAAVLTNLGTYQDSKHLHVHIHAGPRTHR